MNLRIYDSIDEIGQDAVESIEPGIDFCFGVLRAMEVTLWGGMVVRYVTVEDAGGKLLAFTPLYLGSNLNLNALLPQVVQDTYNSLVAVFGSWIATRAAVAGSLISDRGWIPIHPEVDLPGRKACVREILRGIEQIARKFHAQIILLKDIHSDFPDEERALMRAAGYSEGFSLPTMRINTAYQTFDEYLMLELSKNGRKHARKQFHKAEELFNIRVYDDFEAEIDRVFHLHRAVFLKAKFQFEELPPQFFVECNRSSAPNSELIVCERKDGRPAGSLLVFYNHREQQNKRIGVDYSLAESGLVYNLLNYVGIQRAIERRVKTLWLGQSSYLTKTRLGGRLENQYLLLKALDVTLRPTLPLQRAWMKRYSAASITSAVEKGLPV